MTTIVVGVDGSDESHQALRFAIDEAKVRGASLRVTCAWELGMETWGSEVPPPEEVLDRPRRRAEEVVGEARQIVERLAPNVECESLALEAKLGDLGGALLKHSSDASLLVVGRKGHGVADKLLGSVADVVLGSVSQRVVRDAQCPVVVVPHTSPPS